MNKSLTKEPCVSGTVQIKAEENTVGKGENVGKEFRFSTFSPNTIYFVSIPL